MPDTPTAPKARAHRTAPLAPTRDEITALPPFDGLALSQIECVNDADAAQRAFDALQGHAWLGFDTESKPTFVRHEVSSGPHTLQLASLSRAWVFQLHDAHCRQVAARLLADAAVTKVGFGLGSDRAQIRATLGIEAQGLLDLDSVFRQRGYRQSVGVKTAVAIVFGQRFAKSRKQTTSNWAARSLSEGQLRYAANDAWAALRVAEALGLMRDTPARTDSPAPAAMAGGRR